MLHLPINVTLPSYAWVDLLSVRRIPLRRHAYIAESPEGGELIATEEVASQRIKPDPAAKVLMREMQKIAATDRDIHEKVRFYHSLLLRTKYSDGLSCLLDLDLDVRMDRERKASFPLSRLIPSMKRRISSGSRISICLVWLLRSDW